jgi:hypothetical protein
VTDNGKKKVADADEVFQRCASLEEELAEVRAAYDLFFSGVERQPPAKRHADLKKRVGELKRQFVKQTAATFRIQNLAQKLMTYERLWERSLKEIESGVSRRDAFRMKQKSIAPRKTVGTEARQAAHALDEDLDLSDLAVKPPLVSPPVPSAPRPSAPPQLPPIVPSVRPAISPPVNRVVPSAAEHQLSDQKVRAIFDAYVSAKKRCGEDVSKLSLDNVSASLRKQVPQLLQQHKAKAVEFKVVIKDGKAVLRAVPKE